MSGWGTVIQFGSKEYQYTVYSAAEQGANGAISIDQLAGQLGVDASTLPRPDGSEWIVGYHHFSWGTSPLATGTPQSLSSRAGGATGAVPSGGSGFLNSFDYISVGVGFFDLVGGGLHVTIDRNGYITWGLAGGGGLGGKGFGLSLGTYEGDPGTMVHDTRPSADQLRGMNTGWSMNLSAAFGPGIGANWPWHSMYTATELQLQVPGFGLSVGHSWEIAKVDSLSW
jgi:hypothetical protein